VRRTSYCSVYVTPVTVVTRKSVVMLVIVVAKVITTVILITKVCGFCVTYLTFNHT